MILAWTVSHRGVLRTSHAWHCLPFFHLTSKHNILGERKGEQNLFLKAWTMYVTQYVIIWPNENISWFKLLLSFINQNQTKTFFVIYICILQTLRWGQFVFVSLQAGGLRELAGWCEQTTVRMWNTTYIWFRGIIQMFMKTLIVKKSIRQIAKETFVKH